MTLKPLLTGVAAGTPTTLAEIGVATNRDGSLRVDSATLTRALATYPDAVEAMFAAAGGNPTGLSVALAGIATAATDTSLGLGASEKRYAAAQTDLATEQDAIATQSDALSTRLTQQFASMNSKVAAYKSTQAFLKNQIDAWNNKNN